MGLFSGIMLCSDYDGTAAFNAVIAEGNRNAIRRFAAEGGLFVVATGRSPRFIERQALPVPPGPIICYNGTAIWDSAKRQMIRECVLSQRDKQIVTAVFRAFLPFVWHVSIDGKSFGKDCHTVREAVDSLDQPVYKAVFVVQDEEKARCLYRWIRRVYGDAVECNRSWPSGVEIYTNGCGKGVCMDLLRSLYPHIRMTVAAGDYENDTDMISRADIGYAVANAHPDVRALADRIAPDCRANALAFIVTELASECQKKSSSNI